MLSLNLSTEKTAVLSAILAAQSILDQVHTTIAAEAAKVAAALSGMKFADYAVEGPMLTGYFAEDAAE